MLRPQPSIARADLPLGGGCRCKSNDRLVDCAAASSVSGLLRNMVRFYIPSSFGLDLHGAWRRSACHGKPQMFACCRTPWDTWCLGRRRALEKTKSSFIAKTDFLLAVYRGFAGNLPADLRHNFVREVCKWAAKSIPGLTNPLNLQLSDRSSYATKTASEGPMWRFAAVKRSFVLPPLVQANCVLQHMDLFKTWHADQQPIIVSGLEG